MWINFKKEFVWGIGVFILIFFSTNTVYDFSTKFVHKIILSKVATVAEVNSLTKDKNITALIPELKEVNIQLAFVGDIMLDRGVEYMANKYFAGDYGQLFIKVRDELRSYDVLFANLEGPISDKGSDIGGIYSFRMEPEIIPVLKDTGFDVFSVTNNHVFNWGMTAYLDTLKRLSEVGITYIGGGVTGPEAYKEKVLNVDGVKIAFLAFSEFRAGGTVSSSSDSGAAVIIEKEIKDSVSRAKINNDLVIVSYHFGTEYQALPNTYQRKYAELAIDSGADLIIGHHPHVVQTLEQYKNVYIIYSLGNFIFDQYFSPETMQGGLLVAEVNPENKRIEKVVLKKVNLNKYYQVEDIMI